ncbi:MAG: PSD1 and planctomycete cytochrome C domain-containing protein [Prosthecobacter sp.]
MTKLCFTTGSLLCLAFHAATADDDVTAGEKLFALKVRPLFAEKCMACHGDEPDKIKGDLDMRTREAILKGGENFGAKVLMPGKGEKSYLYITTTRTEEDYEMPPKEADQLTREQQWWIRDWINEGAPWPDDERVTMIQKKYAEGQQVATSKALSEDWQNRRYAPEKLWAYRPLKIEAVPEGTNPVDHFITRKLEETGLDPAPAATAQELVRRMRFGLTGLPPKPQEIAAFGAAYDKDPAAAVRDFARKLMSLPQYGEHFALNWLDVARYADSAGFANDYARPNAWRYRDYVIRAFDNDKPYDQFVREQIAGDELDGTNPENLIATGFLRMGPWEQTSMSVFRETRVQWLDDITDSVGQTFLGHALQCAKCHDHKFDPVPTRDYYGMMAVFTTTQFAEPDVPFLKEENLTGMKNSTQWVQAKIAAYQEQHQALNEKVKRQKKQETAEAKVGDNGLDPGDEASLARMSKNMERHRWELDRSRPIVFSVYTGNTIERKNVGSRITPPKNPWAQGKMEADVILNGGDAFSPGEPVKPGALSAAESLGGMKPAPFPADKGARRLALAEWIVDKKNPLTARVMVNRVWSWHFGRGIAGNPNNFGGTGELPTHPQLLDYLAQWFMDHDWSVKQLNELIISSAAYRRSTHHPDPAQLAKLDPKHALYAAFLPRRLRAEEIRDAMLAASGELNPQIGGIPARPDMNLEVAMQPRQIMGGTASVYEPDPLPKQRNRRTIYTEKVRGLRDPFLETFNQPGPDKSCELRETSTVAPQALTLLNAEEIQDRALALAHDLLKSKGDDSAFIRSAFLRALGRSPSPQEMTACLGHWKEATAEEADKKYSPKTYPVSIKRTVMAEKTGEPYDFEEMMPAYRAYQPDLQPHEVDARTRGLAQVCLVIFNLNEFAYLD